MSTIKETTLVVYTTTDGKEFENKYIAAAHQATLDAEDDIQQFVESLRGEGMRPRYVASVERRLREYEFFKATLDKQQKLL